MGILLCFIGVVFLLDKKKRNMLAKELAEGPAEEPAPTEEAADEQGDGWSAWLPSFWPGKSSSQPANPPPPVEPLVEMKTKTKKKGSTLQPAGNACVR